MLKIFLFLVLLLIPLDLKAEFERISGLMESEVNFLVLHPFNKDIIYVSTFDSLYKRDETGDWRLIYKLKEGKINFIYPDPLEYELLFIATDSGLLFTSDGERFNYVFRNRAKDLKCLCLKRVRDKIYLGTDSGLYQAKAGFYDFKRVASLPEDLKVYWIESSENFLFLATSQGVYRSRDLKNFESTFTVVESKEDNLEGEEEESEVSRDVPKIIKKDLYNSKIIYLGTDSGLFISDNAGKKFRKAYLQGLPNVRINFLLQDKDASEILYIATDRGLFKVYLDRKFAMEIYEGLPTNKINCLDMDSRGKIYLATARGVFAEGEDSREFVQREYQLLFSKEPSFREVQNAALEYNEVSPEKIRTWRRSLKYRALMPTLDIGYDKTIAHSNGDFWVGPRDWSVDFTWNLEDLIWNSYQDDVDTRSRLNTQLRLDILEEVNRLYFERRRVKLELLNNPPKDAQEYLKKKLYLEELTASLDAYTGGYFSKRLKELQESNISK